MSRIRDRPETLIAVSAAFVIASAALWVVQPSAWQLPLMGLLFFGACLTVGIVQLLAARQADSPATSSGSSSWVVWWLLGCGVVFGVACGLILWWTLKGNSIGIHQGLPVIIVSAIGVVFFGGGSVVAGVRFLVRRR